jgi:hypothetical protein
MIGGEPSRWDAFNAPVIAIAERAADLIRRTGRSSSALDATVDANLPVGGSTRYRTDLIYEIRNFEQ